MPACLALADDNCGGTNWKDVNTSWIKFRQGFNECTQRTGRDMMLSVEYCHNGEECMDWVADVANLWRTTSDVQATWPSVMANIHAQESMYSIAGHGKAAFNGGWVGGWVCVWVNAGWLITVVVVVVSDCACLAALPEGRALMRLYAISVRDW